jgi:hypothetical protein
MQAAERRLKERFAGFFAERAQDVSRQIFAHLGKRGGIGDPQNLNVTPENAEPIGLPVADVVTRANVQNVSWALAREGEPKTEPRLLKIDDLIATQQVVDHVRIAKHEQQLRDKGEPENAILVLEWDGDLFILDGHHRAQAAENLGWTEIPADVMVAP